MKKFSLAAAGTSALTLFAVASIGVAPTLAHNTPTGKGPRRP